MGRLFGTDGVRGLANRDLTAELTLDLAVAAAHVLADLGEFAGHRPRAVVARDPRASGDFLEAAVVAGLASAGVDVLRVGVLPTPAAAFLTARHGADLGVMLSASHNPMPDNGLKLFSRGGQKLPDHVEDAIETRLGEPWPRPVGADVGRVRVDSAAGQTYVEHLLACTPERLDGLRVVVDCANGAASATSPEALRRAGADVVAICAQPDGWNINDGCGSTDLGPLRAAVLAEGAAAGIAHDGDADRCLAVTADGDVVDGDQILAVLALAARRRDALPGDAVVTTVMANFGFRRAMAASGIEVVETAVGDRYVLEAMRERGVRLGGEQSGHIVLLDHAPTGDGALTALHLLAEVARSGETLAQLASVVQRVPQVLVNVSDVDKARASAPDVRDAVAAAQQRLGEQGRVLLRPSGTEPLVRVMVEALDEVLAAQVAAEVADTVRGNGRGATTSAPG